MIRRAAHRDQLLSNEIKRLIRDPLPKWRVYQVTAIPLTEDIQRNEERCKQARADLVAEMPRIAASQGSIETDNWVVYLANEMSGTGATYTDRGILIEVIDPYDVLEWAFVASSRCISVAKLLPLVYARTSCVVSLDQPNPSPPPVR